MVVGEKFVFYEAYEEVGVGMLLGTFSTESFHSDGDVCGRKRLGEGRRCSRQNIKL